MRATLIALAMMPALAACGALGTAGGPGRVEIRSTRPAPAPGTQEPRSGEVTLSCPADAQVAWIELVVFEDADLDNLHGPHERLLSHTRLEGPFHHPVTVREPVSVDDASSPIAARTLLRMTVRRVDGTRSSVVWRVLDGGAFAL